MKLTRHNGRTGKNGVYNPKHNDRRFNVENSEHIDIQRVGKNIYWDCYQGFSGKTIGIEKQKYSFEDVERIYYFEHYTEYVQKQIELPYPDKAKGKNNNRKQSFDRECRALLFKVCQRNGLQLDEIPSYGGRTYLEKQDLKKLDDKT